MATAEQIKALIRSHASEDPERFFTLSLQLAAHEAQQGHGALALDIRKIVDGIRQSRKLDKRSQTAGDIDSLVMSELPGSMLSTLVLPNILHEKILRIISEHAQKDKLRHYGLAPRRKILLAGPAGTGKTMTARVLSHELRLPLFTVQVDKLVTKFMGETSVRIRQVIDFIRDHEGLYLFDEFDALGGDRNRSDDVGEMRKVLTALLQFIEQDESDSLIVAATNTPGLLDKALFRRFDDVLLYCLPSVEDRQKLIANTTGAFKQKDLDWDKVRTASDGLSSAEVVRACRDAMKEAVLGDQAHVDELALSRAFHERGQARGD